MSLFDDVTHAFGGKPTDLGKLDLSLGHTEVRTNDKKFLGNLGAVHENGRRFPQSWG